MAKSQKVSKCAVVDLETTGLSNDDQIIDLGMILFFYDKKTGEILERLDSYFGQQEPTVDIDRDSAALHGYTRDQLRGKSIDHDKVREIFSQVDFCIAHNAVFDRRFIFWSNEYRDFDDLPWHCSMRSVNWISRGCLDKKLDSVLRLNGISHPDRHTAYNDAEALFKLISLRDPSTGKPYFDEIKKAWPVRTKTEWERDGSPGRFLYGTYVDDWEKWAAWFKKASPREKYGEWKKLTMPQRAQLKRIYRLREPDNPDRALMIALGVVIGIIILGMSFCVYLID